MVRGSSSTTSALERQIQGLIRGDETDAEIDRIIADLLAQEARQAGSSSRDAGPQRRQLNARFLNSVLRNTETHNRALQEREASESSSSRRSPLRQDDGERRSRSKRGGMRDWEQDGRDERRSRSPSSRRPTSRQTTSSSKMDRYFEGSYDPALDVRREPEQDRYGKVEEAGWDRMMELAREKEERKRQRREDRRQGKQNRPREEFADGTGDATRGLYAKTGQQRAWDKGKEKSM